MVVKRFFGERIDIMAKKKNISTLNLKTVGDLKNLLDKYSNDVSLTDIHVKYIEKKRWSMHIEMQCGLNAETDDDVEAIVFDKLNNVFPEAYIDIYDIESRDNDDD